MSTDLTGNFNVANKNNVSKFSGDTWFLRFVQTISRKVNLNPLSTQDVFILKIFFPPLEKCPCPCFPPFYPPCYLKLRSPPFWKNSKKSPPLLKGEGGHYGVPYVFYCIQSIPPNERVPPYKSTFAVTQVMYMHLYRLNKSKVIKEINAQNNCLNRVVCIYLNVRKKPCSNMSMKFPKSLKNLDKNTASSGGESRVY